MKKFIGQLVYSLGLNYSIYSVPEEISVLQKSLPKDFIHRKVSDIGCGNGRISLRLKQALKARSYVGYDVSRGLVNSAVRRGLNAVVSDVEHKEISGDLAVL